jgi:hypothetical protein
MHYKPKSIGALHIALGGLPGHMRIEVEPGIAVSAKTVGELRKATSWPSGVSASLVFAVAGGAVLLLGFHIADEIVRRASLLAHGESS